MNKNKLNNNLSNKNKEFNLPYMKNKSKTIF